MFDKIKRKIKLALVNWELKSIYNYYKNDEIEEEYIYDAVKFISKLLINSTYQYDKDIRETLIILFLYMVRKVGDVEKAKELFFIEFKKGADGSFAQILNRQEIF